MPRSLFRVMLFLALISVASATMFPVQSTSTAAPYTQSLVQPDTAVPVITRSYDEARTGANTSEYALTHSNVVSTTFGKLFTRNVDGQVYAQPLYVPNLNIPGVGTRNVLYVATQHNSVYAFDADDPANGNPFWKVNFGTSLLSEDRNFGTRYNNGLYKDIYPEVGITSTPVIDLSTNTIYIVPTINLNGTYVHRIYALDLRNGTNKTGSPTNPLAAVIPNARGYDSDGNTTELTFESSKQLQRPGLALKKNHQGSNRDILYIAFAGYADTDPYHGWLLAYDAATLQQVAVFSTTPDGGPAPGTGGTVNDGEGGIWMSGQAPALDSQGNIYLVVGNGTFTAHQSGQDYGNAMMKLRLDLNAQPGPKLLVDSWFVPNDYQALNAGDLDMGVAGVTLLPEDLVPNKKLALTGSKVGKFFIVDRDNMGGWQANNDNQIYQSFQAVSTGSLKHIHGTPVFWKSDNAATGSQVYVWGENDKLKAYRWNPVSLKFDTTAVATGTVTLPTGMPGGILTVSSNGQFDNTGIVWAAHVLSGNANPSTRPGVLRAMKANNISQNLWSSNDNPARDNPCGFNFSKFNTPIVANGKVYLSTFGTSSGTGSECIDNATGQFYSGQIIVYGELKTLNLGVTKGNDDKNISGTLSYALSKAGNGDTVQIYPSAGSVITLTASTSAPLSVAAGVRLNGSCVVPTGPAVTIDGKNMANNFGLSGNNIIQGVILQGFLQQPVLIGPGNIIRNNRFACVRIKK